MNLINIDEYFQLPSSDSTNETLFKNILDDFVSNNVKLESLFKNLEAYLTSKDAQKRSKAIKFVSDLISKLPNDYLKTLEIQHISTYLCSKLDDHYTVSTAALPGLQSLLQKYQSFITSETSIKIIKSILTDVHIQSMVQSDRFIVFSMCKFILQSYQLVDEIKKQSYETDFVYGFIQSMDGEKDPRNLLICFECIRLICQNINLGPFVDEAFEVFACYFPIDFTPPKNDNFIITKQMLIDSLRSCFSSTSKFAKNAIPLFLEKLDSSVDDAQLDALETYTQCAPIYDPNFYKEYIEPLWNSFHKISMNATKTNLEEAALNSVNALAQSLSRSIQNADSKNFVSIEWFCNKAIGSCLPYLDEPDLKLVWPNIKCLLSIASSSSTANLLILKSTLPALIQHYNVTTFQNQKKTYLDILWQFVSNSLRFDKKASNVFQESKNELLNICFTNESNKHLRLQSLNGFYYLLSYDNLIDQSSYDSISKCLWHSLWSDGLVSDLSTSEVSLTQNEERNRLIEIFYILIQKDNAILKWLFESLEESILESLKKSTNSFLTSFKMIEQLTSLYSKNNTNKENFVGYTQVLDLFKKLILNFNQENDEYILNYFETLTKIIYNLNNLNDLKKFDFLMFEIIENLLEILMSRENFNPVQNLILSKQLLTIKCSLVFKAFCLHLKHDEESEKFLKKVNQIFLDQSSSGFRPFEAENEVIDKKRLYFYMEIITSLNKTEFKSEIEDVFTKIEVTLKQMALNEAEQESISNMACQFYASLINKIDNTKTEAHIKDIYPILIIEIENKNNDQIKRLKNLFMWIWITKALVLKEHTLFTLFTNKLIEWLDDSELSKQSSESFNTILSDSPDDCLVLTNKFASNIKLFYRQRFFNSVIEPLKNKFDSKESIHNQQKLFYAMSVLNMVSLLPKEVIHKQLKSMLPILLYSLSNANEIEEKICLSSLKSFEILLNESVKTDNSYFLSYLEDILDKLVLMSRYDKNMDVRLLALKCLNNLATNLPPNKLIKHQRNVCKQLEKCLNDKKRLCRQMPVEARNRWFLLTTKNNDN